MNASKHQIECTSGLVSTERILFYLSKSDCLESFDTTNILVYPCDESFILSEILFYNGMNHLTLLKILGVKKFMLLKDF